MAFTSRPEFESNARFKLKPILMVPERVWALFATGSSDGEVFFGRKHPPIWNFVSSAPGDGHKCSPSKRIHHLQLRTLAEAEKAVTDMNVGYTQVFFDIKNIQKCFFCSRGFPQEKDTFIFESSTLLG